MYKKACGTEPYYGTYESTYKNSQIPRINIFPYPYYFVSNPLSNEPSVHPRRAGWSKQETNGLLHPVKDKYPQHCFQAPCKTLYTISKNEIPKDGGKTTGGAKSVCTQNRCITLYR